MEYYSCKRGSKAFNNSITFKTIDYKSIFQMIVNQMIKPQNRS
jgi:hypothetical protein